MPPQSSLTQGPPATSPPDDTRYAATPDEWDRVADVCTRAGIVGFDTEFWYPAGLDVRKASVPRRGRVHVWSLAVCPQGETTASGVVLPWRALRRPSIVRLLGDPGVTKAAHNAPVDVHAVRNTCGVETRGVVDTLQLLKAVVPGHDSYGLKSVCSIVGRELVPYGEVTSEPRYVTVRKTVRRCVECGTIGCTVHKRVKRVPEVVEWREQRGTQEIPLPVLRPGHPGWPRFKRYAADDAVTALELYLWAMDQPHWTPPDPGWAPKVVGW